MAIPSIGAGVSGYTQRVAINAGFDTTYKDQQTQYATACTTTGTAPSFLASPSVAVAAYVDGLEVELKFHANGTGSDTVNINSLGAKNLKQYDSAGAKVAPVIKAGLITKARYDGTDVVILNPLPTTARQIQPITASVAGNALTVTLNPTALDFRSSTLSSGTVNSRTVSAAISATVPSGATLGTTNGIAARLALIVLDNAGTVELGIVNLAGGVNLDETTLISTTALSASSNSISVVYSTTARTNVPYRVVGFVDLTESTAGTWATAPSTIQGCGGQAFDALQSLGYGQTWQDVTGSRALATTYYNTTGRPIALNITANGNAAIYPWINGVAKPGIGNAGTGSATAAQVHFIIPPGNSYAFSSSNASLTATNLTLTAWQELR